MSEAQKREQARQEITELWQAIEPSKNEEIARRALELADHYLVKAENQAKHIQCLEQRNQRTRGKWEVTPIYIKCSECGECYMLMPQNFCPNCGAEMGGEDG